MKKEKNVNWNEMSKADLMYLLHNGILGIALVGAHITVIIYLLATAKFVFAGISLATVFHRTLVKNFFDKFNKKIKEFED